MKIVQLDKVAKIQRNSIKPEEIQDGTIYVGLEHINNDGELDNVGTVENGDLSSSKYKFTENHILYGKLRPYLKKIATPSFDGICSTDILPILTGPELDKRYLFYFLRQQSMVDLATSRSTGANLPRLSPKELAKFEIPLPELGEQRRIAAVLDKADALRQKRRAALAKLDTLLQATFLHMFGDPVTNPMGWEKRPLGEIVEVQTGSTPSRKNAANYGGTIPWVKTTEVDWGIISSTEETVTELGLKNARLKLYPKGSVLIAMYGQGITRGKSAILGIEATVNQACAVLLPSELLITEYLSALLKISYEELRNLGRGGNQPNLNLSLVRSFEIPVPKIQEQIKFAEFQRRIQMQVKHFETAANYLDNLFHALQQRAFSGQL